MSKIIRKKTRAEGGVTAEEKIKLDALAQEYIKIIERTDEIDKEKITKAVEGLYEVSGLKKPRVVIVDSPYVMAVAGGLASAVWNLRGKTHSATDLATRSATSSATFSATRSATFLATSSATDSATDSATSSATHSATFLATFLATDSATSSATDSATDSATHSATFLATDSATRSATDSATFSATRSATSSATFLATFSATDSATRSATSSATFSATSLATREYWLKQLASELVGENNIEFAMTCINNYNHMVQGGNMWMQWDCFLAGCRDVLGLKLPEHKKYKFWEDAGKEGGYRIMHPEFCIVSNFPKWIKKDEENRPHCSTGSQMEWRDGFATYYLHGIRFEKEIFEKLINKQMSFAEIMAIEDVDQRNQALKFVGDDEKVKFLEHVKAEIIDEYSKQSINGNEVIYKLYKIPKGEIFNEDTYVMYYTCPSTGMQNFSGVPESKKVADSMAWKMSDNNTVVTPEEWMSMVPLVDES